MNFPEGKSGVLAQHNFFQNLLFTTATRLAFFHSPSDMLAGHLVLLTLHLKYQGQEIIAKSQRLM
jgi:hypothetical protein